MTPLRRPYLLLLVVILMVAVATGAFAQVGPPPPTRTDDVVDTVHGVPIPDPYRWLEDGSSPEVQAWVKAQYDYFLDYVDSYPDKGKIEAQVKRLMSIGSIGTPSVYDTVYFFRRRDTTQNHSVLFIKRGFDAEPEVLIDPNTFSEDGTVAMDWYYPSDDGSVIAFGKSSSGSENSTLYLMRTSDRAMLPDTIPFTRSVALAWLPDNTGFYYTRFATPGEVAPGDESYYRRVYLHTIGSPWEKDPLIFGKDEPKTAWCGVSLSPDGRRLLLYSYLGPTQIEYYYQDALTPGAPLIPLYDSLEAMVSIIPLNDRFIATTNYAAPRYRVMVGTYDEPTIDHWQEIIPERESLLDETQAIAGRLVTRSLYNAHSVLEIWTLDGQAIRTIDLPTLGTVSSLTGESGGHEAFFSFSSFNLPTTIYHYDFNADTLTQWAQIDPGVDVSNLAVKQVWYPSKDGTKISMFIVHDKGIKLDGTNPTYLYGYGGFNVNQTPYFSRTMSIWYDQGGVYAYPNLRGGGEYGEEWHRAGMLEKKQNTFDDFIAAGEYLIKEGYTNPRMLVAAGGSNGGLLTGAVLVQRPDLWGAVIVNVPLLDMIRYHLFGIARIWIPEYGSSENLDQFKYLYAYSPYQHVEPGTAYPPTLFMASESDGRVDPLHACKMGARVQAANSSNNPIFVRIESKAGHGQGKPVSKWIDDITEEWAFVFKALGIRMK